MVVKSDIGGLPEFGSSSNLGAKGFVQAKRENNSIESISINLIVRTSFQITPAK